MIQLLTIRLYGPRDDLRPMQEQPGAKMCMENIRDSQTTATAYLVHAWSTPKQWFIYFFNMPSEANSYPQLNDSRCCLPAGNDFASPQTSLLNHSTSYHVVD